MRRRPESVDSCGSHIASVVPSEPPSTERRSVARGRVVQLDALIVGALPVRARSARRIAASCSSSRRAAAPLAASRSRFSRIRIGVDLEALQQLAAPGGRRARQPQQLRVASPTPPATRPPRARAPAPCTRARSPPAPGRASCTRAPTRPRPGCACAPSPSSRRGRASPRSRGLADLLLSEQRRRRGRSSRARPPASPSALASAAGGTLIVCHGSDRLGEPELRRDARARSPAIGRRPGRPSAPRARRRAARRGAGEPRRAHEPGRGAQPERASAAPAGAASARPSECARCRSASAAGCARGARQVGEQRHQRAARDQHQRPCRGCPGSSHRGARRRRTGSPTAARSAATSPIDRRRVLRGLAAERHEVESPRDARGRDRSPLSAPISPSLRTRARERRLDVEHRLQPCPVGQLGRDLAARVDAGEQDRLRCQRRPSRRGPGAGCRIGSRPSSGCAISVWRRVRRHASASTGSAALAGCSSAK